MPNVNTNNQLSTKAMLVNLSRSMWTARKHDKRISQETAKREGTTIAQVKDIKTLLPADTKSYKDVQQAFNVVYTDHIEQTLPWDDNGSRLLPATNWATYTQRSKEKKRLAMDAVEAFKLDYPRARKQAEVVLNGAFNASDYPDENKLATLFKIEVKIYPMPDASDFRVTLHDSDVASIKASIEENTVNAINGAVSDLYVRLKNAVGSMTTKLNDEDAIFRDSLVTNIQELCEILPRLNLTQDAKLESFRQEVLDRLANWDAETLRTNKPTRKAVAKQAEKIYNDLASIMGV